MYSICMVNKNTQTKANEDVVNQHIKILEQGGLFYFSSKSKDEAIHHILSKINEINDNYPTKSVTLNKLGIVKGHSLSNFFRINNTQFVINRNLFDSILTELSEEKIISRGKSNKISKLKKIMSGIANPAKTEILVKSLIENVKKYKIVPTDELLYEINVDFQVQSKNLLFEKIKSLIEKKDVNTKLNAKISSIIHKESLKVEVDYDELNQEIRINGILLSRPNFDSPNQQAFEYIFEHANKKVRRKEIAKQEKDYTKDLTKVIADLGFKKELKKWFFPSSSKDAIKLINPVTVNKTKNIDLKKIIRDIKPKKK